MRDGSLDDVVGAWIGRIMDEHWGRNPGDNEAAVYFALLKHAVVGLINTHARFDPVTDYREELSTLLRALQSELPTSRSACERPQSLEPDQEDLAAAPIGPLQVPRGEHADYWQGDTWKKDFYTSFNRSFWDLKDYAHAAGRRKSDFLWDVAEVWVATAASALVYYAKDDHVRWFETAQLLRHFADLTEADGLRSLSWGRWGRFAKGNHRPKPPDSNNAEA